MGFEAHSCGLQSVLPRQGLLESEHHMLQILKYVPDNGSAREAVQRAWQACRARPADEDINVQRWHRLVEVCEKVRDRRFGLRLLIVHSEIPQSPPGQGALLLDDSGLRADPHATVVFLTIGSII